MSLAEVLCAHASYTVYWLLVIRLRKHFIIIRENALYLTMQYQLHNAGMVARELL